MRLIDADAVDSVVSRLNTEGKQITRSEYKLIDSIIFEFPTINVETVVVRCKDCKYNVANMEKDPLDVTDYTDIVCSFFMTDGMEQYDFCSKGELYESNISIR